MFTFHSGVSGIGIVTCPVFGWGGDLDLQLEGFVDGRNLIWSTPGNEAIR